ncbi:MAG: TetR/AcrR family transcriptional regulator [Longimicrobiales bacterium]
MNDPHARTASSGTVPHSEGRGSTSPPDADPGDPGADTRRALLRAGREFFATEGFDGASVRAITGAAGANLGAITYHFGSKRGLYEAVLTTEVGAVAEAVEGAVRSGGTALDRIERIVASYFRVLAEHPHLPRLMLQELAAGRHPPEPVAATFRRIAGAIGRLQTEGQADGSVRPGDPVLTALSVVAQPIYLNLVAPFVGAVLGVDIGDPEHRETMIRHASAFVRAGLAPSTEPST